MADIKKLIEVAIPLDDINAASAREKSIRHGHPSTLHLWWARRPLATARAVLFASLVDAPSSHPEIWPTEEQQDAERQRLFGIMKELVQWENSNNEEVLEKARAEIRKWNPKMPTLLDPFAGGGAIPLEAQRLGLKAIAADLNPVAVMINKAMIEIPPRFKDLPPVNPDDRATLVDGAYHGAQGLARDIHYYGELLKQKAYEKIGHLYPTVKDPVSGEERTVIAWIWARTVKCPNPVCECEMPLVKSFSLSKKKGKEAYVEPITGDDRIRYKVRHGNGHIHEGTIGSHGAKCVCCGQEVPFDYIREESSGGRMGERLLAIVAEGDNCRLYLDANGEDEWLARSVADVDSVQTSLPEQALGFRVQRYGLKKHRQLFSPRQLLMLTTLSDLLPEIEKRIQADATRYLSQDTTKLQDGGKGAKAYSEAVAVYLSFVIDKLADWGSTLCGWNISREGLRNTFARQALSMSWDYAEANPFSSSSGCVDNMLDGVVLAVENLPPSNGGTTIQQNASQDNGLRNIMVSSDPPYYDNIGYADLADFFYVWMRRSLQHIYPNLFGTMVTPKKEELIATPFRFLDTNGKATAKSKAEAKEFFEHGMADVCKLLHEYAREDLPVTIYYAFKQSDTKNEQGKSSSGWETMLSAIIQAGFAITGTWPVRTERPGRTRDLESNALASSIVLVCRKRSTTIGDCSRKDFLRQLRRELASAIVKLQSASIAPVDMMQSAIGPGISVFSRYDHVLEADGTEMSVRTALQIINQELDTFFGGQSEGLDAETRFSIALYTQKGFSEMPFGEADVLSRAMNTSVARVAETGCIVSGKGIVRLTRRTELPPSKRGWKAEPDWMRLQRLAHAMEHDGIRGCAELLMPAIGSEEELKHLAYRMYQIADDRAESSEAAVYNNLVISWEDITARAQQMRDAQPKEQTLFEEDAK